MAYLKLISYEDALKTLLEETETVEGSEGAMLDNALGRVAIADIASPIDVPSYRKSQMDGYAIVSSDSFKASEDSPVQLEVIEEIDAGDIPSKIVSSGMCSYVATGAAVPEGADSVVMIEDVIRDGEKILFSRSTAPGENVMQTGFDVQRGAMIMRKGERVTSRKAAALSGMGITELEVRRMPRIAVISTGSEIVLPGERYGPVNTYDVNGRYLTSECRRLGCDVDFLGIAADNRKALIEKLDLAKLYDLVLVSAGVSKGVKDLMEKTVSEFGEIILHGINIKPGKPTLASRCGGTLMIGLPGHPTSCVMIFKMLVEPLVHKMCGSEHHFKKRKMKLLKRVVATKGRMQFLPIRVSDDGVVPVFRGSGAITSFLNADGIAIIDENTEYLDPGELLEVVLLDD